MLPCWSLALYNGNMLSKRVNKSRRHAYRQDLSNPALWQERQQGVEYPVDVIALELGIFRNASKQKTPFNPNHAKMQLLTKSFLINLDPLAVGAKVVGRRTQIAGSLAESALTFRGLQASRTG
jgi:hypothetical protein